MKPMHRLLVILGFLLGGLQCFSQSVSGELDGHQYVNGEAVPDGGDVDPDGRGFDGGFPYAVKKHVKTK